MRGLIAGLLALCALPLTSCKPDPVFGSELLSVSASKVAAGTFMVRLAWRYGPSDGNGPIDSVIVQAGLDGGVPQEHRHLAAVVRDSFQFTSSPGVPLTGFACVKAKRRALESAPACLPWSYTEADVPPPPPIIDSLTQVVAFLTLPDTLTMMADGVSTGRVCTLLVFPTGQKALVGGQRMTSCEGYEAALTPAEMASTAQYAVAGEWQSCAIERDGIQRCTLSDGSVIVSPVGMGAGPRLVPV